MDGIDKSNITRDPNSRIFDTRRWFSFGKKKNDLILSPLFFFFFRRKLTDQQPAEYIKQKGGRENFEKENARGKREGRKKMEKSTARDFSRAEPSLFFVRDPNDNDNMEKSGQIHRCSPLVTGEKGRGRKGSKYKGCNAKETTAASIVIGNHPRAAVKWKPTKTNLQPYNPSSPLPFFP